ncbi:uncharacterized protein LOC117593919 [Esox lucius]|uniref:Ig-like domain-containing protein n=1 Tax=Esox lucius TaxID=8010 RepID=A0A6Q2XWH9_ESOLU|nr:uncharacterized protein LOC117593919 [Esox lucius]
MALVCHALFFLVLVPLLESKDTTTLLGEVGGAVTFQCSSDLSRPLKWFYIHRPVNESVHEFINGYHSTKPLDTEYANRTYVNHSQRTMKMWDLRPSDEGLYECHISTSKNKVKMQLQVTDTTTLLGEVGGAVTFQCSSDLSNTVKWFYIQRPVNESVPVFINGYHSTKPLDTEYASRTYVNHTQRTMKMWDLRPSDEGLYECHISTSKNKVKMQLQVTANYSIPKVTVTCFHGNCLVTCFSSPGYPREEVKWRLFPNQSLWRIVDSSDYRDPVSLLFSVTSSIVINCRPGRLLNLSCAVGGAVSQEHTICN